MPHHRWEIAGGVLWTSGTAFGAGVTSAHGAWGIAVIFLVLCALAWGITLTVAVAHGEEQAGV